MRLEIERHGLRKPDAVEGTYNNFTRGRDGPLLILHNQHALRTA